MPIYAFRCANGHEWDDLLPMGGMAEKCPTCACTSLIRVIQPGAVHVHIKNNHVDGGRTKTKGYQKGPLIKMGFREGHKSAFARFPGDPQAYVGTKREATRRAAEMGINITSNIADLLPE